jgi:hypothetical protein
MQINRPISLVFPSPAGSQGLKTAGEDPSTSGAGGSTSAAGRLQGSNGAARIVENQALASDAKTLSLQDQLELGKNKGLFAHITYTRDGRIGQAAAQPEPAHGDAFAREAANVMREFSQDLAALKGEAPPTNAQWDSTPKTSEVMANKLRASLQTVASKLHVFA